MTRHINQILLPLLCLALLVGCATRRRTTSDTTSSKQLDRREMLQKVIQANPSPKYIVAKCQITLQNNRSKGEIRAVKDSCIQISVTPILGLEAFRIGILPDRITYQNRFDKSYSEFNDDELRNYTDFPVKQLFQALQTLIMALPVNRNLTPLSNPNEPLHAIEPIKSDYLITPTTNKEASIAYTVDQTGKLRTYDIRFEQAKIKITASYPVQTEAPAEMELTLNSTPLLGISFQPTTTDTEPLINLTPPKSYRMIPPKELFQSLIK